MKTAEKGGKKSREKSHDTFATRPRGLSIKKKKDSAILEQRVTGNPCYRCYNADSVPGNKP